MKVLVLFFLIVTTARADVKSEIIAVLHQQQTAWNSGDLNQFIAAYDTGPDFLFISTVVLRSRDELKQRYEKRYKSVKEKFGNLSFSEIEVQELGCDTARAWGRWQVNESGKISSGWFTLLYKKRKQGWRIIHDHSS
jgi:uncharacterized protein (TIGR02246 family)